MKIVYRKIVCPCCGSGNFDLLKEKKGTYVQFDGKETVWEFDNKIVVCTDCGHVYLNPTPTDEILTDYYSSGIPLYDDASSFDIDKRIAVLSAAWEIAHPGCQITGGGYKTYCEIGANDSSKYKKILGYYFDKIVDIDINENCKANLNNIADLDLKADVIASYFVMEHVGNVANVLKKCYANLSDDGILVIEVPDIEKYVDNPVALEVLEHVNHFSPVSLINACRLHGFKIIYFSREMSSRDCGFVAAFMKGEMSFEDAILFINRTSMEEGLEKVERIRPENIRKMAGNFVPEGTALWCANDMCKEFLNEYECKFGGFDGLIIDEDPRKRNFLDGKVVYTSSQAAGQLMDCKKVVIFSDVRKEVIWKRIKEIARKSICVEYVDDWFEVHKLQ